MITQKELDEIDKEITLLLERATAEELILWLKQRRDQLDADEWRESEKVEYKYNFNGTPIPQ